MSQISNGLNIFNAAKEVGSLQDNCSYILIHFALKRFNIQRAICITNFSNPIIPVFGISRKHGAIMWMYCFSHQEFFTPIDS
ncbi:hypothetical protein SDC9_210321 [bioreactor metagenome]|uniref:Uncharacterized protein n=1 Tax=bioreactor metagenome TaxID=1076179 RepID=A0A645JH71_9ZZZZ